jgi:hypothetical protein
MLAGVVYKKRSQSLVIKSRCWSSKGKSGGGGFLLGSVLIVGSKQNSLVKVEKFILAHFVFNC